MTSDWTVDDLVDANPEASQQLFLSHLRRVGAAADRVVCEAAAQLETLGPPHVACFAQLPFAVNLDKTTFDVQGSHGLVQLTVLPVALKFDDTGNAIPVTEVGLNRVPNMSPASITQLVAFVPLWDPRAHTLRKYLTRLTRYGLQETPIGTVESWMDLPEAKMIESAHRHAPLTPQKFQTEVARRLRRELYMIVQRFVGTYKVAALVDLPRVTRLFGYFAMLAPGRLASAAAPVPILPGLCAQRALRLPGRVDINFLRTQLLNTATSPLHEGDRVLNRLMAMNRLLTEGEPELALTGCVTTVEWFINDRFPQLAKRHKNGRLENASLSRCLDSGLLDFVDKDTRGRLKELAFARNAVVHGAPPLRATTDGAADTDYAAHVRDALSVALDVYRAINLKEAAAQAT